MLFFCALIVLDDPEPTKDPPRESPFSYFIQKLLTNDNFRTTIKEELL